MPCHVLLVINYPPSMHACYDGTVSTDCLVGFLGEICDGCMIRGLGGYHSSSNGLRESDGALLLTDHLGKLS